MIQRSTIIVSFVLMTVVVTGGVEFFCRGLDNSLDVALNKKVLSMNTSQLSLPSASSAVSSPNAKRSNQNYTIIAKRALFGKIAKKEIIKPIESAPVLKATTMDLILLGTIAGESNEQRAIIKDKKGKTQDIYYKGDAIGDAIIKEVRRGEIILTVKGKDELLIMEELKSSSEGAASGAMFEPTPFIPPKKKKRNKRINTLASPSEMGGEVLGGDDPESFFAPPPYIPPTGSIDNDDEPKTPAVILKRKLNSQKQ